MNEEQLVRAVIKELETNHVPKWRKYWKQIIRDTNMGEIERQVSILDTDVKDMNMLVGSLNRKINSVVLDNPGLLWQLWLKAVKSRIGIFFKRTSLCFRSKPKPAPEILGQEKLTRELKEKFWRETYLSSKEKFVPEQNDRDVVDDRRRANK